MDTLPCPFTIVAYTCIQWYILNNLFSKLLYLTSKQCLEAYSIGPNLSSIRSCLIKVHSVCSYESIKGLRVILTFNRKQTIAAFECTGLDFINDHID